MMLTRPALAEVLPGLFAVRVRASAAFLVVAESVTIVDAGAPGSARAIVEALAAIGRGPADVGGIVVTHAHLDHVGGLAELQRYVDAPTAMHAADAGVVTRPEPLPNPFQHRAVAAATDAVLRWIDPGPARVDVLLEDGDGVPGAPGLHIVHMPGHTPGSIAIIEDGGRFVLAGDAMEYRRQRLSPPSAHFTADMAQARASIRHLATMRFEALCLTHFPVVRPDADARVRDLVDGWSD